MSVVWTAREVAAWLAGALPRSAALAHGVLAAILPESHPLQAELAFIAVDAEAQVREDGERVDVRFTPRDSSWTMLAVCLVRVTEVLGAEARSAADRDTRGEVEREAVTGALVVLASPRRFARDTSRGGVDSVLTLEHLADLAVLHGEPEAAERLRAACEHHIAVTHRARVETSSAYWRGYDEEAVKYAAHVAMVKRTGEMDRAREAVFTLVGVALRQPAPAAVIRHRLEKREVRLELSRLAVDAAKLWRAMQPDLPGDMRGGVDGERVHVWLPAPPLDRMQPTDQRPADVRHALLAAWRLRNWLQESMRRWDDWIAAAGGRPPVRAEGEV